MKPKFYVYTLFVDFPEGPLYFYVGGAYGNCDRRLEHTGNKGTAHSSKLIRVFSYAGLSVNRQILEVLNTEQDVLPREQYWWDYMSANHFPVQPTRPGDLTAFWEARNKATQDPEKVALCVAGSQRPEVIENASLKVAQNRPETRNKRSASMKELWKRPDHRIKVREANTLAWTKQETREKYKATIKDRKALTSGGIANWAFSDEDLADAINNIVDVPQKRVRKPLKVFRGTSNKRER